jgi:hypothetical protein
MRGGKRGPNLFKQRDLARAIKSVRQAGARAVNVRLTPGEIVMSVDLTEETPAPANGGDSDLDNWMTKHAREAQGR